MAPIIILDAADIAPAPIAFPWGVRDLALAIATCRHALDDGYLCVILKEDASHIGI